MSDVKQIQVPFGEDALTIRVPAPCVPLRMGKMPVLANSREEILEALRHPIGSPPLDVIIRAKEKAPEELSVCVTVSDITRPVPYSGDKGILRPLLDIVEGTGVVRENITLLIGNGTHRASTAAERLQIFGADIVAEFRIVDHDSDDRGSLVLATHTSRGTAVHVNRLFHGADVKIVTGLVESHFMAGVSGGRKGVCPALVNSSAVQNFHGPEFLEHPNATNLVLEGNPCHEEALEVALSVGVDFLVNTTLDNALRLTGVYAGDLEEAHLAAFGAMKEYCKIPLDAPFDIVLTHGAYVGRNHYQCAKAAVCAMPAVKDGGLLLLAANNYDAEPVGSPEYRTLLHLLKLFGPDRYAAILKSKDWLFTRDQWEPEMWAKPLRKVGMDGLIYCAPQIDEKDAVFLPGIMGGRFLEGNETFASPRDKAELMFQGAVDWALAHPRFEGMSPAMAFIEEGPYAIPMIEE